MANTITPTPSGSGIRVCTVGTGKQYADAAAAQAYATTQNPVSEGAILCFEYYESQTLPVIDFQMPGGTTNSNFYVIHRFVPGFNQSFDGDGVAVAYTNSGGEFVFNSANQCRWQAGVVFEDMNVRFTGTASAAGLRVNYDFSTRYQTFRRCRILVELSNPYAIDTGYNNGRLFLEDNLVFFAAGCTSALYRSNQGEVNERRNTYARLGSAGKVGIGSGFGTKADSAYSNMGGSAYGFTDGSGSYSNNISDNAADTQSGFTVVDPATMFSANGDYRPRSGGSLIAQASASAQNTNDLFSKPRGTSPNVGAIQRAYLPGAPTGTITNTSVTTTTGNKRRVTITGTTTGTPTSGLASINPTVVTGNNGVAQTGITVTLGSGTFTAVFDDVKIGRYTQTITLTNSVSSTSVSGATAFDVIGATGTITSQPAPNGQKQSVSGTTAGSPDSGAITWNIDPAAADGSTQGPFALTLGTNTFSDIDRVLPPGTYLAPVVTFTIPAGTSFPATGGSAVKIIGISGNPQAPEPDASGATVTGVSISPQTPTIAGAGTQAFIATVTGANSPPQTVTWTTTIGAINSSGVLTAPATMSSAQTGTVTATSTVDPTKSGSTTFTVPAGTVTPVVTGVSVSPSSTTVTGGATQSFTATVSGTGSPSQGVTWSKVSGVGTVSSSGIYTAPAGTQAVQNAVIKATSTQDGSFSGNASITIPANSSSFVAKITVPLGSAAANLTGLKWAWHDQPTPDLFVGPPTDKGAAETADSAGTVVILLPNSTKTASGQIGHIEIMNSDGTTTTPYSGFVGPWAVD